MIPVQLLEAQTGERVLDIGFNDQNQNVVAGILPKRITAL
jgi:hypothetical protein